MSATSSSTSTPSPLVYTPSQEFIGNDGQWSAFILRVGTPSQNFRVLPAFRSGEVYIPIVDGCLKDNITNCGALRGASDFNGRPSNGFIVNASSSWHEIGIYDMDIRPELNFNANALYGEDNLGLMVQNSGGPTLTNQVVAGVAKPAVYVGMLGLGIKPANFSEFESPQKSMIQSLKDEGHIPSLSHGYTAGAYYKTPKALGSLTLGGFDQSRFEPNDITFPFDPNDDRPVSLNIQSIVAKNTYSGTVNLLDLDQPTYIQIDPTVPHLWLPASTCDRIATAFKLHYDNTTDLYLVNDTIHAELQLWNPTITIGLGATADPTQRVNVVLPYGAFDLQASHPIYPNATNYFPIRRGYNESMYTLGRTFLQEAYVKVDYERGSFSVHQALFPATNEKQQVFPIVAPGMDPTISATRSGNRLEKGAITGLVIGIIAFVSLAAFFITRYLRRHRRTEVSQPRSEDSSEELPSEGRHEKDGPALCEADGIHYYELYYEGLQMIVNTGPSYELSGSLGSYELADNRSVRIKDLEADAAVTRPCSGESTT
ncbi:acid protease [Lentithecium fluviatile CBS 122367]|uniref:Acid protease n=1 Tax=Lentithecium fluviatile CBS 122367 TaxID=1168545 RepID=A0A6G1JHZ4_9PLEO|nr:acid protease [Lentithecium fluviatile CBS 122367]